MTFSNLTFAYKNNDKRGYIILNTGYVDVSQMNTFELADAGMDCLTEWFGVVGAEAFIAMILREKLDYTKWRNTFYGKMQPGEFHKKALDYAESHPYTGEAPRL